MVPVCKPIVACRERHLGYRYDFQTNYKSGSNYVEQLSSHGIDLKKTTQGLDLDDVHPELAAAAINSEEAIIQVDGKTIVADIDEIDHNKVELACDGDGCVLIPDDGNPYNDIVVSDDDVAQSSHGIELHRTAEGLDLRNVHPEIAAAAINPHEALI